MKQKIHFIAIGGAAMHNLALALAAAGHQISGSDDEIFEPSRSRLQKAGLLPEQNGWFPEKIDASLDAVILGMHARKDNPELQKALELNIPVYSYPAFMAKAAENKQRVVIGGSHGKTTITSMILHSMRLNNIGTDYIVGAMISGFEFMAGMKPENKFAVYEGDEYLASALEPLPKFIVYKPHIGLISGIAWDHVNVFPTFENYLEQFNRFIAELPENGTLVYNAEDEVVLKLVEKHRNRNLRFIPYHTLSYRNQNEQYQVQYQDQWFPVSIRGRHNIQNLSGAMEIAKLLGISPADFFTSLQNFQGASRRMETLHVDSENQFTVIRDFGHSPSKVKATMEAVAETWPDRKMVVCFELHTYSSLSANFLPEYAPCFQNFQSAFVFYDPHALALKKLPALSRKQVAESMGLPISQVFDSPDTLSQTMQQQPLKNAVWLLMSSGNLGGNDPKTWFKPE